ncbi:hypothetical protein STCU_10726 [Strigomonas culicis]|uniref:Alpha-type protein kinase domain-containing protein n=1 Tax=Strigomonas culicis TaxID=28005 RepID=S9URN2_9TRYP|nr:hypothetical protein STCU_10726 [Strigomonas culicis]|eukprot:EPY17251.1 hypothetical protein STCU_10726 [Strigomonas culicis]
MPYRLTQRAALEPFAEHAVIYEWNLKEGCWNRIATRMVVSPEPFAHGNMRASYYMIDMTRLNCRLVAKRYLRRSVGDDQYFDDVSMHSISGHWARMYNAMDPPKKVKFVPAAVVELPERSPPLILALEPQLDGQFKKYNNNCGYVPRNARWTPQAFSHYTYHASRHQLMIVDIQGVDDIYTDPQILSPDGEGYGRGNLGMKGIRRFLESHRCNSVCKALGLPPVNHYTEGAAEPMRATSARGDIANIEGERLPPKVYKREAALSTSRTGSQASPSASSPVSPAPVPGLAGPAYVPGVPGHNTKFMQHIRDAIKRNQSTYFANTAGMLVPVGSPIHTGGGSQGQMSQHQSGMATPMGASTPSSIGFIPRPPSDCRISGSGRMVDRRPSAFSSVEEGPRRFYNK